MKHKNIGYLIILWTIFAMPGMGWAVNLYVNPGESIESAVDKANPGDTVIVTKGLYREVVTFNKSGVAGAPITVKAQEGDEVILEGMQALSGWQRCQQDDEGLTVLGQGNPHWSDIYWTYIDASAISRLARLDPL